MSPGPDSSFFDRFVTQIDNIAANISGKLSDIKSIEKKQLRLLNRLVGSGVEPSLRPKVELYEYSNEVAANTPIGGPDSVSRSMPFSGTIVNVTVGWPDGASNLVGVQLRNNDRNENPVLVPTNAQDDFIAANDFTGKFGAGFDVDQGDEIEARFVNNDQNNPHFINLFVEIEEDI